MPSTPQAPAGACSTVPAGGVPLPAASPVFGRVRGLVAAAVVVLLLVVLPLVSVPQAWDIREPARRLTIALALAQGVLLLHLDARSGQRRPVLARDVGIALGVVLLVVTAASAGSREPLVSVLGRYPRYEGLLMIAAYLAMPVLGALVLTGRRLRDLALWCLTGTTVWLAICAAGDYATRAAGSGRALTPLGNATTVGVWGVICLSLLGWHLWYRRLWWMWVGTGASFVLVLLSASRGGITGVVGACIAGALVALGRRGPRWVWPFVGVIAAMLASALAFPLTRARIFGDDPGAGVNVSIRLTMWKETVRLIQESPLLGVGPSQWVSRQPAHRTAEHYVTMLGRPPLDGTHNVVLQVLTVAGALGLLATLALGAVVLRRLARSPVGDADATGAGAQAAGLISALAGTLAALMFAYTEPVFVVPLLFLLGGSLTVSAAGPAGSGDANGAAGAEGAVHSPHAHSPHAHSPRARLLRAGRAALAAVAAVALVGSTLALRSEVRAKQALQARPERTSALMVSALRTRPWDGDLPLRVVEWEAFLNDRGLQHRVPLDALALSGRACARLGEDPRCLLLQARTRNSSSQHVLALESADRGLALAPADPELMRERSRALAYLGRTGEAYTESMRIVAAYPRLALGYETRARVQASVGLVTAAEESMSVADTLLVADPQQVRQFPRW